MSSPNRPRPGSPGDKGGEKIPHPVYSDFVHMQQMSNLFFAVGLREDNAEEMLGKIAPLARYVPGDAKKREIRKVDKKEKPCTSEVCKERRNRLDTLVHDNENLKNQLKEKEAKLAAIQNKVHLTEKSIVMVDEKIESLRTQVEDLSVRIPGIEAEVVKGEQFNATLESRLEELKREFLALQNQPIEEDVATVSTTGGGGGHSHSPIRAHLPDPNQKIVFSKTKIFDTKAALEVSSLGNRVGSKANGSFYESDSDSDDDE